MCRVVVRSVGDKGLPLCRFVGKISVVSCTYPLVIVLALVGDENPILDRFLTSGISYGCDEFLGIALRDFFVVVMKPTYDELRENLEKG